LEKRSSAGGERRRKKKVAPRKRGKRRGYRQKRSVWLGKHGRNKTDGREDVYFSAGGGGGRRGPLTFAFQREKGKKSRRVTPLYQIKGKRVFRQQPTLDRMRKGKNVKNRESGFGGGGGGGKRWLERGS